MFINFPLFALPSRKLLSFKYLTVKKAKCDANRAVSSTIKNPFVSFRAEASVLSLNLFGKIPTIKITVLFLIKLLPDDAKLFEIR